LALEPAENIDSAMAMGDIRRFVDHGRHGAFGVRQFMEE
jgi:hypothetical protein